MNYLNAREVREKFSVSRQTIWEWRKRHGFPEPHKLGGVSRWCEQEVEEWAEEQKRQTA